MIIARIIILALLGVIVGYVVKILSLSLCMSDASLKKVKSRCLFCGNRITFFKYIKYILLHTNCLYCNKKLPFKYHFIELTIILNFIITGLLINDYVKLFVSLVLSTILMTASVVDIKIMKVPYYCILSLLLIGSLLIFVSLVNGGERWKEQLLGSAFIVLVFIIPTFMGRLGGGDFQLMAASGLVIGLRGTVLAVLMALIIGAIGSMIITLRSNRDEKNKIQTSVSDAFFAWYNKQKMQHTALCNQESDTIYINIINNKICIDEYCYNYKKWTSKPDIGDFKTMLEDDFQNPISNCAITINVTDTNTGAVSINQINCRRIIPFVPYWSVAFITMFIMFG